MNKLLFRAALLALVMATGILRGYSQVTVTSSDSLSCTTTCTTLTATVTGDSPTPSGIAIDDIYSPVLPIGFHFNYYGTIYDSVVIGPNGTLCFDLTLAGAYDPWPITAVLLGNASKFNNICGPWCDIDISIPGGGTITYSLTGVAPYRKYVVTFCNDHMYSCTTQITSTQIILYETTNVIECHIATKPICSGWNGGHAIIGVQNATGTAATVAPGRDFPSVYTCTNEAWRFTPDATVSSYAVASIAYAPIPYASSAVYWYNDNTGAYLGTGTTMTVCPTVPTMYKAGALGCADTSFGYYLVTPAPTFTLSLTSINPSRCGDCDGSITVGGFLPGLPDTITYDKGGVPQTPIYAVASAAGTITISGLCSGTYSNFVGRQGTCASVPAGPITLTDPPMALMVTPVPQSICGACDGSLVLTGLYQSHPFTITYSYNGVPQPAVSTTSDATGSITLYGLCEGTYSSIMASFGTCSTTPTGPYPLNGPAPPAGSIVSFTHPTECGLCNGTIRLKQVVPYSSDTIFYTFNSVAQPPIVTTALGDSTIFLPGLCEGTYSGFSVKIGHCVTDILGTAVLDAPPLAAAFDTTFSLGCNGDTVFFHNHSTSTGPLYYVWDFGDGQTDTSRDPVHVYDTGTFTVRLLSTNHHCIDSAKMTFTLGHPLVAAFTRTPAIICQGDAVTFTNASVGATGYAWIFGNGATSTASDPNNAYNQHGTYQPMLVASNNIPCYDTAMAIVEVDTAGSVAIKVTDSVFCSGAYVTMQGLFTDNGNTGVTWIFDNADSVIGENPVKHAFNTEGVHSVRANVYYRACPDLTTKRDLAVFSKPSIDLGPDTTICKGSGAITLADRANAGNKAASWKWSTGVTGNNSVIVAPGTYYATVTVNGCSNTDSVKVANDCYVEIPNVFTPNGDGVNDYFFPRQLLTSGLVSFNMQVFNRWGQLLFETSSLDGAGWDGTYNGKPQPQGVYVYVIDAAFKDGQHEHHQGNVTILR